MATPATGGAAEGGEEQTEWPEGASYADYGYSSLEEFQAAAAQQQQMMMLMMGGGIYDESQAQLYGQLGMMPYMQMPSLFSRVPLPSDNQAAAVEEQPTYVNAKQYRRIIKRRQARALLEKKKAIPAQRKVYLHESRHKHAMRRPRGPGGRFLVKLELDELKRLLGGRELEAGCPEEKQLVAEAVANHLANVTAAAAALGGEPQAPPMQNQSAGGMAGVMAGGTSFPALGGMSNNPKEDAKKRARGV